MRKSENTPAAASRPATKPSKRDAADAMRSATEYLIATRQAERALKASNCAPTFRLRTSAASRSRRVRCSGTAGVVYVLRSKRPHDQVYATPSLQRSEIRVRASDTFAS